LETAGFGTVSEVFNGDYPYSPGGCIAQAWSVAEIFRAYVEDVLEVRPLLSTISPVVLSTISQEMDMMSFSSMKINEKTT
ncbi:MAG: amylo-alpha-1,6-glucosidase, partial [Methanosarcina vacuolata]|nr:amylo-alpha-1,6-glucosidase [Methanosarcina vacuolata]